MTLIADVCLVFFGCIVVGSFIGYLMYRTPKVLLDERKRKSILFRKFSRDWLPVNLPKKYTMAEIKRALFMNWIDNRIAVAFAKRDRPILFRNFKQRRKMNNE